MVYSRVVLAAGCTWALVAGSASLVWERLTIERVARAYLSLITGWALCGALLFVAGHLQTLHKAVVVAGGAIGFALCGRFVVRDRARVAKGARSLREVPVVFGSLIAICAAASAAVIFRVTATGDELEYKWTTPLSWAAEGRFVDVKARLSNGWNLAEYLAIPGALWQDLPAARLNALALALTLALGGAALAAQIGGSVRMQWFVAAAVFTMPPVLLQSWQLGNDIPAAMFLVGSLIALFACSRRSLAIPLLVCAAMWTKVFALAVAVPILLFAVVCDDDRVTIDWPGLGVAVRRGMRLAAPIAVFSVIGLLHTAVLTGSVWAPRVRSIYPSNHPFVASAAAAGRIPDLVDVVTLPVVPILAGVIGQREPYGSRTGLIAFAALALLVFGWRRWNVRGRPLVTLGIATMSYLIVAPVFIKTRFLLFNYIGWLAAAVVVISAATWSARGRRVGPVAFAGLIIVLWISAIMDPLRVLVRLTA